MKPKIYIASPTNGGRVYSDYCTSLYRLGMSLRDAGIESYYKSNSGSDISLQRDLLADEFLRRQDFTHLLFIDTDMRPARDLAQKLLAANKPLIGTIYARRQLDIPALSKFSRTRDDAAALALAHSFNFRVSGPMSYGSELCTVEGIGMGFVLIARQVFDAIAEKGVKTYPYGHDRSRILKAFFRPIELPDGSLLSEDFSFCERWRQAGGEVFVYHPADIQHVGDMRFSVPFTDYIKANKG